jgi:hypothetical protein
VANERSAAAGEPVRDGARRPHEFRRHARDFKLRPRYRPVLGRRDDTRVDGF